MLNKLKEIICNFVDVDSDEITAESVFTNDLGLCSLDFAMLSSEIEKEFGVIVNAKTFAAVKTVGGLTDYIEGIK